MEEFMLTDEEIRAIIAPISTLWEDNYIMPEEYAIANVQVKKLVGWLGRWNSAKPTNYLVLEPIDWQRLLKAVGDE